MKKTAIIAAISLVSYAAMAGKDLSFERNLNLNTDRLSGLEIDAGAGSIEVVGTSGNEIQVYATITSDDYKNMDDMQEGFESKMILSLKRDSGYGLLTAKQKKMSGNWGNKNLAINLQVEIPRGLELVIDDGSGSISVENVDGTVTIDDGSGSITLRDIGNSVEIEDGSGSIQITDVNGDVEVDDGSGSIDLKNIYGNVSVEDGSGSINGKKITGDFKVDDGSGDVVVKGLEGEFILIDDGSGSIRVNGERWDKK